MFIPDNDAKKMIELEVPNKVAKLNRLGSSLFEVYFEGIGARIQLDLSKCWEVYLKRKLNRLR